MWPIPVFRPSDPGDSLVWLRPWDGDQRGSQPASHAGPQLPRMLSWHCHLVGAVALMSLSRFICFREISNTTQRKKTLHMVVSYYTICVIVLTPFYNIGSFRFS